MIARDYTDTIDAHSVPTLIPPQHSPYEVEETEPELVYQPAPTCGQCEHFYQSKHPKAWFSAWGFCPLLGTERRMSDKPCKLHREDVPF